MLRKIVHGVLIAAWVATAAALPLALPQPAAATVIVATFGFDASAEGHTGANLNWGASNGVGGGGGLVLNASSVNTPAFASGSITITPGHTYRIGAALYDSGGGYTDFGLRWYTAGGSAISFCL